MHRSTRTIGGKGRTHHGYRRAAAATLLMGGLQLCVPGGASAFAPKNIVHPVVAGYRIGIITHDAGDAFSLRNAGEGMVASGYRRNTDTNDRIVFWSRGAAFAADEQTCDSWTSSEPQQQEGVALRITFKDGVTKALTVTKNIWGGANWVFNVHLMDSWDVRTPFVLLRSFDLESAFKPHGTYVGQPWSLCARTRDGTLSFVAWPTAEVEPAYGNPTYGGSVAIPTAAPPRGYGGWYFGHVQAGGSILYTTLSATMR